MQVAAVASRRACLAGPPGCAVSELIRIVLVPRYVGACCWAVTCRLKRGGPCLARFPRSANVQAKRGPDDKLQAMPTCGIQLVD
jgi:hypothetical protein